MRHGHPARPHATESEMFTRHEIDRAIARLERMCDRIDAIEMKMGEWLSGEVKSELDSLYIRVAHLEEKIDRAESAWRRS